MLSIEEAKALVAAWLAHEVGFQDAPNLSAAIDAHIVLYNSVPQPLVDAYTAELQAQAPPGIVMKAESYLGRLRILAIKQKAAAQWAARPPNEHD